MCSESKKQQQKNTKTEKEHRGIIFMFSMCCQQDFVSLHINLQCFTLLAPHLLNHWNHPIGCEQTLLARCQSTWTTTTRRCCCSQPQSLSWSTCPSWTGVCRSRTCRHGRNLLPTTQCQFGTSGSHLDSAPKTNMFMSKRRKDPNPWAPGGHWAPSTHLHHKRSAAVSLTGVSTLAVFWAIP